MVAAVERLVVDNRIEQSVVVECGLEAHRVGWVLEAASDVFILIQADAPVLHDRAVRTLVAAGTRVVIDTLDLHTIRERLLRTHDPV